MKRVGAKCADPSFSSDSPELHYDRTSHTQGLIRCRNDYPPRLLPMHRLVVTPFVKNWTSIRVQDVPETPSSRRHDRHVRAQGHHDELRLGDDLHLVVAGTHLVRRLPADEATNATACGNLQRVMNADGAMPRERDCGLARFSDVS